MRTGLSTLEELAAALRTTPEPIAENWTGIHRIFRDWVDMLGVRAELRAYVRSLAGTEAGDEVISRSKEATTHFAWCLYDRSEDPFSLWLHEYKPCRNWLPGYANSVHNHRYHFSTTLLSGGYLHERFTADLDPTSAAIRSVHRQRAIECHAGNTGYLLSHEFHRIPQADDDTMTFLVKSRMVAPWSLSYDPDTRLSQRHIPMQRRLADLAGRL